MGFLVVILACIINGAFFLYFSMTSSFWVFFSSVCFFSSLFALYFSKPNFIWFGCAQFVFGFPTDLFEALCCLAVLWKRGVLLVTFFVLDWSRPLRCRSAGLMLVIGRLDFAFFWSKQHLIQGRATVYRNGPQCTIVMMLRARHSNNT